ncbi:277_t:CDS:1 [Dentiscutata erythropus]|uniref:277_t:CDS:1 n=1 Tax=Dentiscutata erythropus TaxID=1348616 RepID=A0A9N9N7M8_9GLOM|nr:277_t:CDS:1 [Dentiscutata erythropus]
MFTAQPRKIRNYATSACERCKMAKKKCTGKCPCDNCVIRDAECIFSEKKKRGPKSRSQQRTETTSESSKHDNDLHVNMNVTSFQEPELYSGLQFDITPLMLPSLTDFPNNNISAAGVSTIFSEYENTHQHFIGYKDQNLSFCNYSDSCINISENVSIPENVISNTFLNENWMNCLYGNNFF